MMFNILCCGLLISMTAVFHLVRSYPLHASCKISWTFPSTAYAIVNSKIVNQMKKWETPDNCAQGGEKCLYKIASRAVGEIKGTHTTPVKHYVDDISFQLANVTSGCNVGGFSRSETWYAVLDDGTNYCNLHNLITGSGLDKMTGYTETTSDSVCTEYSSADCEKY